MMAWLQVWWILLHGLFSQMVYPFPGPRVLTIPPPSSGMLVWFEADAGNNCGGIACTDGASQDTWADQSGNGRTGHGDGTFGLGVFQPKCQAGVYHTNQINGKPAITFNGSQTMPTCFAFGSNIDLSGGASIFVVAKNGTNCTDADEAHACSFMGGEGGSLNYQSGGSLHNPGLAYACDSQIGSSSAIPGTSWVQQNATYLSPNYAFRVSRSAAGSGSNAKPIQANNTGIGGNGCSTTVTEYYQVQMAEIIIYNRVLSAGEITIVETYFNSKYGL